MSPAPLDPALLQTAKAYALWGSLAYDRGLYRLPELKNESTTEPTAVAVNKATVSQEISDESRIELIVD